MKFKQGCESHCVNDQMEQPTQPTLRRQRARFQAVWVFGWSDAQQGTEFEALLVRTTDTRHECYMLSTLVFKHDGGEPWHGVCYTHLVVAAHSEQLPRRAPRDAAPLDPQRVLVRGMLRQLPPVRRVH
jgi:hypothetical protein